MDALIISASLIGILLAGILVLNLVLRRSLRAPRVVEACELARHGLNGREISLPTRRGKHLFGWLLPGNPDAGAPSVIVLHGWGANAEMMLPLARPLQAAGFTVLLFDARNHGRSDADSFSSLPRFAEDLDAAIDWLKAQPEAHADRIAVVGHSVGAAAALLAASRRDDLACVISLAAFAHPAVMMRRWLRGKHLAWFPLGWYVLHYVQHVIGHRFDTIAPVNTVARIVCPLLLVHGAEDSTIPVADAHAIHARRTHDQVRLRVFPGEHDSADELERHSTELIEFLQDAFARVSEAPRP